MGRNRIIFINGSGFKSGKDTAAAIIRDQIVNLDIHRKGRMMIKGMFAYNLKKYVGSITGEVMERNHHSGWSHVHEDFTQNQKDKFIPAFGMSLGKMLQIIGTEGLRHGFHKEVHVIGEAFRINSFLEGFPEGYPEGMDKTIIFPDWRFQNEAGIAKNLQELTGEDWDSYTVQVRRDEIDRSSDSRSMAHASESANLIYGHEIDNNGSLRDLEITCEAFVNDFIKFD